MRSGKNLLWRKLSFSVCVLSAVCWVEGVLGSVFAVLA